MPAISHGDVRIHYALGGREDGELLVLSNSLGSNLRMWSKVLPRLEAVYRVLRFDTRGHGTSSVPPGPYTLDQLGHDVLSLLDDLGMDRVNFCGLSLGGAVGMWLAIHEPQRLRRLVLANTAARFASPAFWDERISTVRQCGMEVISIATLSRWFTLQYRETHAEELRQIHTMIASTDPDGYCACCAFLREMDLRTCIPSIHVPALVIAGTHDQSTPPSDGRLLADTLPDSHYIELDASHLSAWECAGEFADAVLSFLGGRRNG